MQISNFIVVRFSLRLSGEWLRKAYGAEENRGAWLRMRADLFRNTMYRSILAQTVPAQAILLLLDEGDRGFFAAAFGQDSPLLIPIFSKPGNHYGPAVEFIAASGAENVAVSRGDSDDIVAVDYLERVNAAIRTAVADNRPFDYLVATRGYVTDGTDIQEIYYSCSPFLTLFRKVWDGPNIYAINHELVVEFPHIPVEDARWMQYVHGTNIGNRFLPSTNDRPLFEQAIRRGPKKTGTKPVAAAGFWPAGFHDIRA